MFQTRNEIGLQRILLVEFLFIEEKRYETVALMVLFCFLIYTSMGRKYRRTV